MIRIAYDRELLRKLLPVALLTLATSWCLGQTAGTRPERKPETEGAQEFQAKALAVVSEYELRGGDGGSVMFTRLPEPVLRWANPLGGHRAHGEIFLWTNQGLPVAILSINEFTRVNGKIDGEHEWRSLMNEPIEAKGPHLWSPRSGEFSFTPLPSDEKLADSLAQRLRQMRAMAARFSGTKTTRTGETRGLRLMPQPLYRYQSQDASRPDGALFALAEATDPEVLLILEARGSGPAWHYAFARLNSVKLTGLLDERQVWEAPALAPAEVYERTDKPYAAFVSP